ncbi:alpha/beta hydrolase [Riemerella anatipestifer]|uniref:alpha/beta hydrolase n=1 Tax=Riemerella anatipestifer TaxID=34085 RepID=UPI00129E1525|nr:alpha/beta hydrolase [Riemerella anatipestifer]MRM84001.1 alpha/beta hydrolase [Riemerella anatipestifer]
MNKILLLTFLFFSLKVFSQKKSYYEQFEHYQIIKKNDTINFHIFTKNKENKKILLFIQGSGPQSIYHIIEKNDTIRKENSDTFDVIKNNIVYSSNPFSLKNFPNDYNLVIISKKGFKFETKNNDTIATKSYYQNENLNYRVWQSDEVVKYITTKIIKHPTKVVALGHSEGTDVVAKLGTVNKKITHIGYWSGGANTQFYDFALLDRRKVYEGKMSDEEYKEKYDSLVNQMNSIFSDPNNINKEFFGCTYERWSGFSEPAIENLLKINVPIFVVHGAKDESVPVESSLLIPLEFIRNNKSNLTYKFYPDLNHSLMTVPNDSNKEPISKWNEIFDEFIKWCEK